MLNKVLKWSELQTLFSLLAWYYSLQYITHLLISSVIVTFFRNLSEEETMGFREFDSQYSDK